VPSMRSSVSAQEVPPVVVGVDGELTELPIVDVAAAVAVRRAAPLEIVHAWPGRHPGVPWQLTALSAVEEGRHLLDLAVRRVRHAYPALRVHAELLDAGAAEALVKVSEHASLLVVGHRQEDGPGHAWGSTAAYLAHHSACPLLVHRGSSPGHGPVVLAFSGRRSGTVGCAFEAAADAGCGLIAVHACDSAERGAGEPLEQVRAGWPGVTVERLFISAADIPYTTARASRRGRLLVAGRGRKGWFVEQLTSAVIGSAGERLLCPVLLVPPGWPAAAA
jgi:nucleotide-binding universal stress UspA family protein